MSEMVTRTTSPKRQPGSARRWRVAMAALWLIAPTAVTAQESTAKPCRDDGALRICAEHVSLSGQDSRQRMVVTADAKITLHNTGKLPLSFFALRREGQFLPDQGPALAGAVKVFGLPQCQRSATDCAGDRKLIPLTVQAGGSASLGVSVTEFVPREEAQRLARAQKVSFSWEVLMIDAEQRASVVSLSLPSATLDNGLAGSR